MSDLQAIEDEGWAAAVAGVAREASPYFGSNYNLFWMKGWEAFQIVRRNAPFSAGYATAFYEIAALLGIAARAASPAEVWRDEMRPKLEALITKPDAGDDVERLRAALRSIAEGNLGDLPWQANYAKVKQVAADALAAMCEGVGRGTVEREAVLNHLRWWDAQNGDAEPGWLGALIGQIENGEYLAARKGDPA